MPVARTDKETLQQLVDERDINRLVVDYAAAVDGRNWDAFERFFTVDAIIDYREGFGPFGPATQVRDWMQANLTVEHLPVCQHLISNMAVDVDGNRATAVADFFNPVIERDTSGSHTLRLNAGSYRMAAARTSEGWQLEKLTSRLHWSHWTEGGNLQVPQWPGSVKNSEMTGPTAES